MKNETLYIAGKIWKVEFVDPAPVIDGEVQNGICDPHSWTVKVWAKHPDPFAVLLHEIDHGVISSVLNTHPSDEEACVQGHETGWVSIIRDPRNIWFVKRIAEAAGLTTTETSRRRKK